jgi:hypothetical protein
MKKKIKIYTTGILPIKNFLYGPVYTPYMEDTTTLFEMITSNVDVREVLDNNEELKLTINNFDKDNNIKTPANVDSVVAKEDKKTKDSSTTPVEVVETKSEIKVEKPTPASEDSDDVDTTETTTETVTDEEKDDKKTKESNIKKNKNRK